MARNKRPSLTSPWKIGFFASLLMVAVGIGVGYFITRAFGLTWTWIEFHGTWSDWTFHQDSFMNEMFPLAVLVPAMSLLTYVLITNAVRKYQGVPGSGPDYKQLVKAMRQIEDLENENQIKKLGAYPEVRDFVQKLKRGVAERTESLDADEAALREREAKAATYDGLAAETEALVGAVLNARSGSLPPDLELRTPELRRVEQAVRELLGRDPRESQEQAQWVALRDGLYESANALRGRLADIREELSASERSARELEAELRRLRAKMPTALEAPAAGTGSGADDAIARLDTISGVLRALGEETKRAAINTALHASSGTSAADSVVQLADDVRSVAAKFNGVALQWEEASALARASLRVGAAPRVGKQDAILDALDSITGRTGLWVERTVVLSEKMRSFDQHYEDAFRALEAKLAVESAPEHTPEDWSPQTSQPAMSIGQPQEAEGADFERQADPNDILIGDDTEAEAGFEKQKRLFGATSSSSEDDVFADIPVSAGPDDFSVDRDGGPVTLETGDGNSPMHVDGLTSGAAIPRTLPDVPPAATGFATRSHVEEIDTIPSIDDEAISLYLLGAVDYEPENAHHNA